MLYLVRHGQSQANAEGRLAGRSDYGLTELGRTQAAAAGRAVARAVVHGTNAVPPVRVVSSPLSRARDTADAVVAELVAAGIEVDGDVIVDARLVELDYGELDGVVLREFDREQWAAWRLDPAWRPPGGETLVELQARVTGWCEELATSAGVTSPGGVGAAGGSGGGVVVGVSHVSPIKACAIWALRGGPEMSWRMSLGVASITRVALSPPAVVSFGETAHLPS